MLAIRNGIPRRRSRRTTWYKGRFWGRVDSQRIGHHLSRAQGKKADMTGETPAGAKRRILVIEDEMLISMLLEDMLADLGHEVAGVVPRLNEAMTAVQGDTFDL